MAAAGPWRALRCLVLAVVVLAVSGGAHTAAGGAMPEPVVLAALAVVVVCAAAALTRWRLSGSVVLAALGTSQVLLHHTLSALAPPTVPGCGLLPLAHASHGAAGPSGPALSCQVSDVASHHAATPSAAPLLMLAAHVVVTAALALLLAHGERLVWELWAWMTPLVVLLGLVRVAPARRPRFTAAPDPLLPSTVLLLSAPRRGPPVMPRAVVPLRA